MGALLDTSVLIAIERGRLPADIIATSLVAPLAIAAVTASELLQGVLRAATSAQRTKRSEFVERALASFTIVAFDVAIARVHAELVAELDNAGARIGAHDEMIAATAIALGFSVATRDARSFPRVPGLTVHLW